MRGSELRFMGPVSRLRVFETRGSRMFPRTTPLALLLAACAGDKPAETGDTASSEEISDLLPLLRGIDGVVDPFEAEGTTPDTRLYVFGFEQPVDHDDATLGTFTQYVSVVHRDTSAPVVLDTRGYGNNWSGADNELSWALGANRVNVEHRYFMSSRPADPDWSRLRVKQATADLHAVVTALKSLYTGPWISTGASKGGENALFYRAHYPDDVVGTVAYVAPLLRGYPDDSFGSFFEEIGTEECRDRLLALQRSLLSDREGLAADLEVQAEAVGESFSWVGADWALQVSVAELAWSFWQYDGDCAALPTEPEDLGVVWPWFLDWVGSPYSYGDGSLTYYSPYFYQSMAEIGYPTVPYDAISDLLTVNPDDVTPLLPTDEIPSYDGSVVEEAATWLSSEGSELLLVYGDQDPWTVRALELDGATDSYSFTAVGANHGAVIAMLSAEDQALAWEAISRWTGVDVDPTRAARTVPARMETIERPPGRW